jgi:fido (protein-threonine AMPylation protein)
LPNNEEQYLESLIKDFPCDTPLKAAQALTTIATRYTQLEESASDFVGLLPKDRGSFSATILQIAVKLHGFLFKDILANAGEYRKITDRGGGFVGFGKDKPRNPSQTQFQGIAATRIQPELAKLSQLLNPQDIDPAKSAIEWYQKFVLIHPFYDANGRIARFIVTIYLHYHGYQIQWKAIEEKHREKFLRKLNACHLRSGKPEYEKYFNILYRFWNQFVISIDQLERT